MPTLLIIILTLPTLLLGQASAPSLTCQKKAQVIVSAVIKAQHGGEEAIQLKSFSGKFRFRVFEYEKSGKLKSSRPGSIEQSWARAGTDGKEKTAYRRTLVTDNSRPETLLLDFENHAWRIPDDSKLPPVALRRKQHKKDRENLRDEARRINRLLSSFVVTDVNDLKGLRLMSEGEEVSFVISREKFHFKETDLVAFDDTDGTFVEWWVDRKTHFVVKTRMTRKKDASQPLPLVFHMGYHVPVKVTGCERKLTVPHWINYLEGDRPLIEIITSKKGAIQINSLDDDDQKRLFQARRN